MATDSEVIYAEIIELPTLSSQQKDITLISTSRVTSFKDTSKLGAQLTMDEELVPSMKDRPDNRLSNLGTCIEVDENMVPPMEGPPNKQLANLGTYITIDDGSVSPMESARDNRLSNLGTCIATCEKLLPPMESRRDNRLSGLGTCIAVDDQLVLSMEGPPDNRLSNLGTYITMDDGQVPRMDDPLSGQADSTIQWLAASALEVKLEPVYQNSGVVQSAPVLGSSTGDILPRCREDSGTGVVAPDESLPLGRRLRIMKRRCTFMDYSVYAMEETYREVEKMLYFDVIFLFFAVGTLLLGFTNLNGCKASPLLPVILVGCSVLDMTANFLGILAPFIKDKETMRDIVRTTRFVALIVHLYGVVAVYIIMSPEEKDRSSPEFCSQHLFWTSFAYFHLTSLVSLSVFVAMLTTAAFYYV